MSTSYYRQAWSDFKNAQAGTEQIGRLARQIAASFMDGFLKDGSFSEDHITLLCEMSTQGTDDVSEQVAARALFGTIIERLCDEFEELPTDTYNQVMSQVVAFCRRLPEGSALDHRLTEAGIDSSQDMISRINRIRQQENRLKRGPAPDKIFVLSRVTLGADVAVTSIILRRLADCYPQAELILLGSLKSKEIFEGWDRIKIAPLTYKRDGGLLERLETWHQVHRVISDFRKADIGSRAILMDPDSRLSQLGLLPLMPEEDYFYLNSRSADIRKNRLSMGALTNSWLDRICDENTFTHPGVWPKADLVEKAAVFCDGLRNNGARRLIVINFGVGGNPRKKVGRRFEHVLLQRLLREPGTVILLDKGFGDEESEGSAQLLKTVGETGHPVFEAGLDERPSESMQSGVIGLQMGIGELAAVIKSSDEYFGYDSAGQHIAAALEIPCVTVFAGSNSMRFIQRWAALGAGERHIVHVDTLTNPGAIDIEDVIERVITARGEK